MATIVFMARVMMYSGCRTNLGLMERVTRGSVVGISELWIHRHLE